MCLLLGRGSNRHLTPAPAEVVLCSVEEGTTVACASGPVRQVWSQIAAEPMTTPDQTPDTDQDVQELTDESLDEVTGGANFQDCALSEDQLDGVRALTAEPLNGPWMLR
jgi:hypothetical protein